MSRPKRAEERFLVGFHVNTALKRAIQREAMRQGITVAAWMRKVVEDRIERSGSMAEDVPMA